MFSPTLKIPADVEEENERIKTQEVAKKQMYMKTVHPVKHSPSDEPIFKMEHEASAASLQSTDDQNGDSGDVKADAQQEVFHGDVSDETQILSVFANFTVRKLEARRNMFDAST